MWDENTFLSHEELGGISMETFFNLFLKLHTKKKKLKIYGDFG